MPDPSTGTPARGAGAQGGQGTQGEIDALIQRVDAALGSDGQLL